MRVVGLEDAVHDAPVYVGAHPVKGYIQPFADRARGSIATDEKLCIEDLLSASATVAHRGPHRVRHAVRIIDGKAADDAATLNERLVAEQVADEDALDLALGDDVQASVSRVGLVRPVEEQLLPVLVNGCPLNQRALLVDLGGKTPL